MTTDNNEPTTTTTVTTAEETPENKTDLVVAEGTAAEETDAAAAAEEDAATKKAGCIKKIAIGLFLLGLIIFVIIDSRTNRWVFSGLVAFLEWVQNNVVAGVFGFMALYFLATIFFVPGSILTLGAGFVFSAALNSLGWGVLLGTGAVWVGASLGATASFLLGRYLFRGWVGVLTEKYTIFKALDNALMDKGLRIMVLLRLSPIVPFNVLNYMAGVTGVQLWHYVVACVAMLPGTILYVFLGASAGSLTAISGGTDTEGDDPDADEEGPVSTRVTIIVVIVGVVFGILAIAVTSYYAKQELNKVLEQEKPEGEEDDNEAEENPGDGNDEEKAQAAVDKNEEGSM
eukprot:CAMPEP_0197188254 /NCGR_PEP_ID=MMETSP1423-20130617/17522_1 /TAXON_ID=476441 /ORGANISM="Pseudo-nitzschia heimii, Strain UNC1101" /LENGTH=343 /DNA_ID=CAMNT_0042640049 /DNA_START=46 /DNA_END=1077 /DNA_ORIENTATION=-